MEPRPGYGAATDRERGYVYRSIVMEPRPAGSGDTFAAPFRSRLHIPVAAPYRRQIVRPWIPKLTLVGPAPQQSADDDQLDRGDRRRGRPRVGLPQHRLAALPGAGVAANRSVAGSATRVCIAALSARYAATARSHAASSGGQRPRPKPVPDRPVRRPVGRGSMVNWRMSHWSDAKGVRVGVAKGCTEPGRPSPPGGGAGPPRPPCRTRGEPRRRGAGRAGVRGVAAGGRSAWSPRGTLRGPATLFGAVVAYSIHGRVDRARLHQLSREQGQHLLEFLLGVVDNGTGYTSSIARSWIATARTSGSGSRLVPNTSSRRGTPLRWMKRTVTASRCPGLVSTWSNHLAQLPRGPPGTRRPPQVGANQVVRREIQESGRGRVREPHDAIGPDQCQSVMNALDQCPEQCADGLPKLSARRFILINVGAGAEPSRDCALGVPNRLTPDQEPPVLTVAAAQSLFNFVSCARADPLRFQATRVGGQVRRGGTIQLQSQPSRSSMGRPEYSAHRRLRYSRVPSGPATQTSCGSAAQPRGESRRGRSRTQWGSEGRDTQS